MAIEVNPLWFDPIRETRIPNISDIIEVEDCFFMITGFDKAKRTFEVFNMKTGSYESITMFKMLLLMAMSPTIY